MFGIPEIQEINLKWSLRTHWNMKIHFFSMTQHADEAWAHNQMLAMVKSGAIRLEEFISDYIPFDHVVPALERFCRNEYKGKVIVTF